MLLIANRIILIYSKKKKEREKSIPAAKKMFLEELKVNLAMAPCGLEGKRWASLDRTLLIYDG